MLDFDLAVLYETETKRLKEAVKLNANRFPSDFMFEITREEYNFLRRQLTTLEKGREKYSKYLPYALTEQGVAMLSTVLKSNKAIEVNIAIMRAFVFMRQYALTHKDLTEKLNEFEKTYNKQFADLYEALNYLINKDKKKEKPETTKRIGYKHYDLEKNELVYFAL